ncbi:MAG TPA: hypothetical protein VHT34_13230 [Clostridia bacterium]|nr:hypothetical protein [Clostridia bacterium]
MVKKILLSLCIIVVIIGSIISFIYKDIIFQEERPMELLYGILKLNVSSDAIVKVSKEPLTRYVAKSEKSVKPFNEILKRNGWSFKEQIGAGIVIEKKTVLLKRFKLKSLLQTICLYGINQMSCSSFRCFVNSERDMNWDG